MSVKSFIQDCYNTASKEVIDFIEKRNLINVIAPVMWCFEAYPTLSIILSLLIITYSIPICIFLVFIVLSLSITLTGFVLIEGTVIGVALVVLFSVLSVITITLGSILFFLWIMYISISQICETFLPNLMVQVVTVPANQARTKVYRGS